MASRGEELLISADSHIVEDPHFWEDRLPAACKDQAPVFPEREVGGLFQAHPGGWDPHERVKEMEVDGVSGEVLYPSFAMNLFGLQDAALQEACFRAYNDWILEYCSVAPDRLYGVSCIPTYDIDHGVAELARCRNAGLPGALVWQAPPPELSFATTTMSACGQRLRIWMCPSASTSSRASPSLGRARWAQAADARPSRPCAAP